MTTQYFPDSDSFSICGDKSPGIARLTKCDSPSGLDIRKAIGLSGATVVPTGQELAEIEFEIEIWNESQIPAWYAFAKKWLTRPVFNPGSFNPSVAAATPPAPGALTWNMLGDQPGAPSPSLNVPPAASASSGQSIRQQFESLALPIIHPGLNGAPIFVTSVIRKNCTALVNDGLGCWRSTVSFLQFKLPKQVALPKPTTSLPNTKNPRPTAMTAHEKEIQANYATIGALR